MSIRVAVVDDEPLVREAYRAFLRRRPEFEWVGEASDGDEAVALCVETSPDLVLMDLGMARLSGVDATRELVARWPDLPVVVLTTFAGPEHIVPALQAGAAGYLLKGVSGEGLVTALHQALAGNMPLSAPIRRALVSSMRDAAPKPDPGLTPRETELVSLVAEGLTNAQIARRMNISEGTVKQSLSQVTGKLGVRTRTQVVIKAVQLGIVRP